MPFAQPIRLPPEIMAMIFRVPHKASDTLCPNSVFGYEGNRQGQGCDALPMGALPSKVVSRLCGYLERCTDADPRCCPLATAEPQNIIYEERQGSCLHVDSVPTYRTRFSRRISTGGYLAIATQKCAIFPRASGPCNVHPWTRCSDSREGFYFVWADVTRMD